MREFDLTVQFLLIIFSILAYILEINEPEIKIVYFISMFFLGIWQVCSFLINYLYYFFTDKNYEFQYKLVLYFFIALLSLGLLILFGNTIFISIATLIPLIPAFYYWYVYSEDK